MRTPKPNPPPAPKRSSGSSATDGEWDAGVPLSALSGRQISMIHPRRFWLVLPVALLFGLDVTFTLIGQPASYWAGDRRTANEANPFAYELLVLHPGLFVGLALAWTALLGAVIVRRTHRPSTALAMIVAIAHALGGSSWLLRSGDWGLALAGGYLVLASQFCFWCWRRGSGGGALYASTPAGAPMIRNTLS